MDKILARSLMRNDKKQIVVPETGIILVQSVENPLWEVWYKGVRFAELMDLKEAHDRLQKLLALDSTK